MKKFYIVIILCSLFGCTSTWTNREPADATTNSAEISPTPAKLSADELISYQLAHGRRETRVLKLKNDLEVLLISDEKAEKSAAAVNVAVGSLMSPPEYLGLAHYLEHMLFLGTQKYPDAAEYSKYIEQNGGYSNAFTSEEYTNYHFEVNTSAFESALDRFAQFFIAPTFNKDQIPTEIKNVNSEYKKNIEQTGWRKFYLSQVLSTSQHPLHNTFQGCDETLSSVPQDVLLDFYKKYYSANQMKLVLVSSLSLDQQESMVREKFSLVPNHKRPDLTYPQEIVKPQDLPRLIEFQTADPTKAISLHFYLPSSLGHWDSKPLSFLTHMLNYGGPGSLSSQLKKQGWITSIESDDITRRFTSEYVIEAVLTDKGYANYPKVVKAIMAQIQNIANQGLSSVVYQDMERMMKLSYIFGSSPKGADGASGFAKRMAEFGHAEDLESKSNLLSRWDPVLFKRYVDSLTADRMSIFLSGPKVRGRIKSRFYDFKYSIHDLKKQIWFVDIEKSLLEKSSLEKSNQYALPGKNSYLPKDLSLLDASKVVPGRVMENNMGDLWVVPTQFKTPLATITLSFLRPKSLSTPLSTALDIVYTSAVEESLTEWGYEARLAGIGYTVTSSARDVTVVVSGYSERVSLFVENLLSRLSNLSLDERQFQTIMNQLSDQVKSVRKKVAYEHAVAVWRSLRDPDGFLVEQWGAELSKISRNDVLKYSKNLFLKTNIKMLSFGNLSVDQSTQLFERLPTLLNSQPLPEKDRSSRHLEIAIPEGQSFAFSQQSEGINNAWIGWLSFGPLNLKNEALAALAGSYFGNSFYEEMRTKRTLGYITQAWHPASNLTPALAFLIQSQKSPEELSKIAMEWSENWIDVDKNLTDADFEAYKKGLIEELIQPPESYASELSIVAKAVFKDNGDLSYRPRLAKEIQSVSKADLGMALKEIFSQSKRRSLGIYLRAKGAASSPLPDQVEILDLQKFHRDIKDKSYSRH
ncbi:MAG TPA: insulinase family protein [Pseudobdellovibrionaceae bacterium]|nr:insulinase family protein [Pseudobdellovibrionaceae bacterium]